MRLWITRDVDNGSVCIWDTQPECRGGTYWTGSNGRKYVLPVDELVAKLLLGDQWLDDGQFCFEIDVTLIKRVLSQPQTLVKNLLAMTRDTCCAETLRKAADLIESLSK